MPRTLLTFFAAATIMSTSAGFAEVVYQAPENVVGGYCPTCAGLATRTGDDISLANGSATLTSMTWDATNFGDEYLANIGVEFYSVDTSGSAPAVGELLESVTTFETLAANSREFVDIPLGGLTLPERFIYSIGVNNNNGSTNWNMAGQFANNAEDENESLAEARIGTNNELDFIFGDYTEIRDTDPSDLLFRRLSMDSYQLALEQNEDFPPFSNVTPNVTFETADAAAVPVPASLPLLAGAMSLTGLMGWRRRTSHT